MACILYNAWQDGNNAIEKVAAVVAFVLAVPLDYVDTAIGAIIGTIVTALITNYFKKQGPIIREVDLWGMNFFRDEDIVTWATKAERAEYALQIALFNDKDVAVFMRDIRLRFASKGRTILEHRPIIRPTWTRPLEAPAVDIVELPSRRLVLLSVDGSLERSKYGALFERLAESDSVTFVGKLSDGGAFEEPLSPQGIFQPQRT